MTSEITHISDELIISSYKEYYSQIKAYIALRIVHRYEAEDLAQDVFIRLLTYKQMLRQDTITCFIFTIAHNIVTDYTRRYYKKQEMDSYLYETFEQASNETEERIIADDLLHTEKRIVSLLPSKRREVYKLSRYEGMEVKEIANHLNISYRTAGNLLYLGRSDVRQYLKNCI